jgi:hypothetical protein
VIFWLEQVRVQCSEFLVEREQIFDTLAIILEGLRTVTKLDCVVQSGVGFDETRRHGQGVV